ncbi:LysR family transcriptional regulator [Nocardia seriolae]|nr:LysR family transcriptional regulator [Nocardia seriolae]MTJ63322.1 LysR family transcriptional regulator [Nocardia seriolae]MTJ71198.1 LysR family transcriptional regulator [Nocardia seriolae]MTJ88877.1 LysR family transcriptional regulator [Nocardia seriolae]MTK32859.1 LysR family transcriptional regulator [Nocardia seriolae]MTK41217.1 LysR family transcriptional regulator [Nocardia seriolae]
MTFGDASLTALRVFREVAERGTLTAAAATLGYTQSAVSRQIAALERAAGTPLLERRHDGVRLTPAGRIVARRAAAVIDQIDATARELAGLPDDRATVRLGWFASAGAALVPPALTRLRHSHPGITVVGREGGTPALVRALRAGTLDLALVASTPPYRPLDAESPALQVQVLSERSLRVAVPAAHPLARGEHIDIADLHGQTWIAGPGTDLAMGVWPGLDERPTIAHTVRDWLAKLHLVAAGCGITTVPASLAPVCPPGVRVLPVHGGPAEQRRLLLARPPGPLPEPVARVADTLQAVAVEAALTTRAFRA